MFFKLDRNPEKHSKKAVSWGACAAAVSVPSQSMVNVTSFSNISQYNLTQPSGNHSQSAHHNCLQGRMFSSGEVFLSLYSEGPLENRTVLYRHEVSWKLSFLWVCWS